MPWDLDHFGQQLAVRHQPPRAAHVPDIADREAAVRQQREAVRQKAVDLAPGEELLPPVWPQAGDAAALVRNEHVAARGRHHAFGSGQIPADELQVRYGEPE
jgi:hypothetical protein